MNVGEQSTGRVGKTRLDRVTRHATTSPSRGAGPDCSLHRWSTLPARTPTPGGVRLLGFGHQLTYPPYNNETRSSHHGVMPKAPLLPLAGGGGLGRGGGWEGHLRRPWTPEAGTFDN